MELDQGFLAEDSASKNVAAHWGEDLAQSYDSRGLAHSVGFGFHPAILVVDMANAFTDPAYRLGAAMDDTISAIGSLLDAARSSGLPIIYTVSAFRSPPEEIGMAALKIPALGELRLDTSAVQIDSRLTPQDGDLVIVKKYWSSFMMTNLLSVLVYKRIDTLIICGNSTSGCVRAAATDAICYGFRPIIPFECVADRSPGPHQANLFDINAKFGDVRSLASVLQYFSELRHRGAAS